MIVEVGVRTPLLDCFRRGEATRDVRLCAAQGVLAPRALEQLALLAMLTGDADAEVASAAETTLAAIPEQSLASFLARADIPAEMRTFFSARGVEPSGPATTTGDHPFGLPPSGPETDARLPALQRIAALTIPQRVALATKGTREERAILVRDPNKLVAIAVLSSPKLTDAEVEAIAKMTGVSDEVLRLIAVTRTWIKNYLVVVALVRNPKTPVAVSMNLLPRLMERDLRLLSSDRNVADLVRLTARRKLVIG